MRGIFQWGLITSALCSKSLSLRQAPNGSMGSGRPGEGERAARPNGQDQGVCGSAVYCGEGPGQAVRFVTNLGESWDKGGQGSLRSTGSETRRDRSVPGQVKAGRAKWSSPERGRFRGPLLSAR